VLQTINGFDLLLIIIIIALGYRTFSLNRECHSYVEQILRLSWDLQAEIQENVMWQAKYEYDSDLAEPAFIPASHDHHPEQHEYLSYCDCKKCIPF
jgi:hypothetical protein